jgi:nucleoside phosphorylase
MAARAVAPTTDVLLVAAFPPELAALHPVLGSEMAGRIGDVTVAARALGIGLVAAASGAALAMAEVRPRAVLLLGTCGAYDRASLAIGDVVVSRRVRLVDSSVLSGTAQFPDLMQTTIEAEGHLSGALENAGARAANIAATLAITVDDAAARFVAQASDSDVEHLEAFAVASASVAAHVAFSAVLGVANRVGASARGEWRANHHRAAERAVDCALRWLRDGARGMPNG